MQADFQELRHELLVLALVAERFLKVFPLHTMNINFKMLSYMYISLHIRLAGGEGALRLTIYGDLQEATHLSRVDENDLEIIYLSVKLPQLQM